MAIKKAYTQLISNYVSRQLGTSDKSFRNRKVAKVVLEVFRGNAIRKQPPKKLKY